MINGNVLLLLPVFGKVCTRHVATSCVRRVMGVSEANKLSYSHEYRSRNDAILYYRVCGELLGEREKLCNRFEGSIGRILVLSLHPLLLLLLSYSSP